MIEETPAAFQPPVPIPSAPPPVSQNVLGNQSTGTEDLNIIVYPSIWKLLAITTGALLFVILGFFFILSKPLIGLASIGFGAICGGYGLFRLVVRKPSLVINNEGIMDNGSAASIGWVTWSEIQDAKLSNDVVASFLSIYLKDNSAIVNRLPAWKRSMVLASINMTDGAAINIPNSTVALPLDQLLEKIKNRLSHPTV